MKTCSQKTALGVIAALIVSAVAGCPLPYDYNGAGPGKQAPDPSSPDTTSVVTAAATPQGGAAATVANGATFVSGSTTTLTLTTATSNSVIYYTDDGTTVSNFSSVKKLDGSSGTITITRTTTSQTLDIHAVAIGSNMFPSVPAEFKVEVSPYPIISINVNNTSVTEDGGTATFTVTSSLAPANNITVSLGASGNYSAGTDETGVPGPSSTMTAVIASGATSAQVVVTGVHDAAVANHTVTLTVQNDTNNPPAYTVGGASSSTVTILDDGLFTVAYSGNGGSGPVPASGYYTPGATVTVAGAGSLVRTGYYFTGWNTQANGTGTAYAGSGSATFSMPGANVTLYAQWALSTYSVTYSANGGSGAPTDPSSPYTQGALVTVLSTGSMSNGTSLFGGWNTAPDGSGTTYAGSGSATFSMPGANVTLYAIWLTMSGTTLTAVPANATNVIIPSGVTTIALGAFHDDRNLVSVTIPSSVTSIAIQAFDGCSNLTTITSNSAQYPMLNGGLVQVSNNTLEVVPAKYSGPFTIDSSVTAIESYAFDQCGSLTGITIPPTMTTFGNDNAFSGITSPITITIPATVTSIPAYTFYNCSITDIYMVSSTPPLLGQPSAIGASMTVHVPSGTVTAYQTATNWSAFASQITSP